MSTNSNDQGRAYEYAWMTALYKTLVKLRNTKKVENSSLTANERAWYKIANDKRITFTISAESAVGKVIEIEPIMAENDNDTLMLEFQKDEAGEAGDVRDIVIRRDEIDWEVGLSIKHNHDAVKHSRLSHVLDFGNEWYGIPCSQQYWSDIKPVFDMLKEEKDNGTRWSDIIDKEDCVYVPLLRAFMDEINRVYEKSPDLPRKIFEYLVGIKDYHKIVSRDDKKMTLIHTFNIHDTLCKPAKIKKSIFDGIPVAEAPIEITLLRFKRGSKTTIEMYMDNGWGFSFRIHSASTIVQPSLKFDVQFMSLPPSVWHSECVWSEK